MKRFIFFCVLIFQTTLLLSNARIDSLIQKLRHAPNAEKVSVLIDLCRAHAYFDIEKARAYGMKAYDLAKKLGDKNGEANALFRLGMVSSIENKLEESNAFSRDAIDVFKSQNDASGIAKCLNILGLNATHIGSYDRALDHLDEALGIFRILDDSSYVLKVQGNMANVHYLRGDNHRALAVYEQLIVAFRKRGDKNNLARNIGNAARVYNRKGDYLKALTLFFEANKILDGLGQTYEQANNLNSIGLVFKGLYLTNEAVDAFIEGLGLFNQLETTKGVAEIHHNLGSCYFRLGDYDKARNSISTALEVYEDIGVKDVGHSLNLLAILEISNNNFPLALELLDRSCHLDSSLHIEDGLALGNHLKGRVYFELNDLDRAEHYLNSAFALREKNGELTNLQSTADLLAHVYERKNECELAFFFQKTVADLADSLSRKEKKSELMRMLIRQQLVNNGMNISSEAVQKERHIAQYLIFLLPIGVAIGFLYFRGISKRGRFSGTEEKSSRLGGSEAIHDDVFLSRVDLAIEEHLGDASFTPHQLSEVLGVSTSILNIKIKESTGLSVSKYIRKKRLSRAAHLLKDTTLNISEIAYGTGFEPNYFARIFRRVYGYSPKAYRKMHG